MKDSHLSNEEKLDHIYEMTLQNHEILEGMRKRERITTSIRIFYWLVVIGALGGAYYYVRPFIDAVTRHRTEIDNTLSQFEEFRSSLPETKAISEFLHNLKNKAEGEATTTGNQSQ